MIEEVIMSKKEKLIEYLHQLIETYTNNFYLSRDFFNEDYWFYRYGYQELKNTYIKEITRVLKSLCNEDNHTIVKHLIEVN